jgi:hypothetical protein
MLSCVVAFGITTAENAHADATIFGSISNNAGAPLCGLVLANGVFVFSCSPTGQYSLTVPLDASGQITLFGFADGHFPFKQVLGGSGGRYDMTLILASSSPPPTNTNLSKTQQLVGGTWFIIFTIGAINFTDNWSFTSIGPTPDASGDYATFGTDQFGKTIAGSYYSPGAYWDVLDKGTIIDEFYTFHFSDNNDISGCYYQISPPGSTNLSSCYALSGFRSPPKAASVASVSEVLMHEEALLSEVASDGYRKVVDPAVVAAYLRLRAAGADNR